MIVKKCGFIFILCSLFWTIILIHLVNDNYNVKVEIQNLISKSQKSNNSVKNFFSIYTEPVNSIETVQNLINVSEKYDNIYSNTKIIINNTIITNQGKEIYRNDELDNLLFIKEFSNKQFSKDDAQIDIKKTKSSFKTIIEFPQKSIYKDLTTNGIIQFGDLTQKRYAVFSSTTSPDIPESKSFLFYLPLTLLAWKRIQFGSVVVLIAMDDLYREVAKLKNGAKEDNFGLLPGRYALFGFVLRTLRELGAVVIIMNCEGLHEIKFSQVSRIFTPSIIRHIFGPLSDDVYVVTSDADLWPIDSDAYQPPATHRFLSLNSECCGSFPHRGVDYKMLPLSNVGASVEDWVRLIESEEANDRDAIYNGSKIIKILKMEFGEDLILKRTVKGENRGWYLDQMLLSIYIREKTDSRQVKMVRRNTGADRLDKSGWPFGQEAAILPTKVDAHLFANAFEPRNWGKLRGLVVALHSDEVVQWCERYVATFNSI